MGSLVISERTFSHVQEMASTESNTGVMIEGNCSAEKAKKHQFTQHFYQKVISCRLCAEKLAFKKQKFDDESAVYRIKKKVSGLTLVVLQPDHNTATTSSRPICVCEAEISTPAGVTKATAHRGAG